MQVDDTPRRQVVKTKNLIIFLCLIVFVLAYAGCAEKHLTKSDGTASAQNESANKQNEQPSAGGKSAIQNEQPSLAGEPAKQNNSEEQTTRESAVSQITTCLKDIHFDFDQYSLRPEDRQILSSHADYLLKNKNVKVIIEGNCDERGTTEYNLALGDRRAQEAMNFLVNSGVDRERIKAISYGKERPLDPGHNEEAWARNRRDHFVSPCTVQETPKLMRTDQSLKLMQGKYKTTTNHEERQITRPINEKSIDNSAVDWSPDGKSIATAGDPMQVTIWDSVSLSIRHQLNQGVRDWGGGNITFSPDSKYLASGLGAVNVWNVADGTLQATLIAPHITTHKPQYRGIESLCYSPDGRMLVVVYTGDKQIVIAYRIADGKVAWTYEPQLTLEPQRTKGSPLLTTPLVFTPDGKRVIFSTGEWSGYDVNLKWLSRILLLDAESGEFLRSIDDIHMNIPTALALSHDGKWVATGTSTGERYQRTNKKTHQVVTFENKDPVRIWNVATGKLVRELPVHSRVWSLAFSQDGKYLFGATRDINVWDTESGKMVQVMKSNPEPMSLALSPDGKRLAAACQSKLSIYEIMNFP